MTDWLFAATLFLQEQYPFVLALMLALSLLTLKRRSVLLLALFLVIISLPFLKAAYAQDRPCTLAGASSLEGKLFPCDSDYGMPSGHSATAVVFAIASLGTLWFFVFAPLAAFIAYSRVLAGVHTFPQMAAGISLGITVYALSLSISHPLFERTGINPWFRSVQRKFQNFLGWGKEVKRKK